MYPTRIFSAAATAAVLVGLTTACTSSDTDDWIEVNSPAADAQVSVPFEVILDASTPLGPPTEATHHAHIWFGDDQELFLVVESNTVQISNAPAGAQTMHVSLHLADHTPVGAETSVQLMIDGDGTGPPPSDRDY
jgi:hypothetical protein